MMGAHTFTAFCRRCSGEGTIWIDTVEAENPDAAAAAARDECAGDWECSPEAVHCIGLASGDTAIVAWDDENCLTTHSPTAPQWSPPGAESIAEERNKVTRQYCEMKRVINRLAHEIEQMQPSFDDADGSIQAALDAAEKYR